MSTRCQIRFVFSDGKVLTYQHSDGYPTYAVANIVEFLKWNKGRNMQYDYVIANWFYFNKKSSESLCDRTWDYKKNKAVKVTKPYAMNYNNAKYANDPNLPTKLGYGLDYHGKLHGDIEYFYDIIFTENVRENDKFGDIHNEKISFQIFAYKPLYDYSKHELKADNPDILVAISEPFYKLSIDNIDNVSSDSLSKELEMAENKATEISNKEYEDAKAKGLVNY